MYLHEDGRLPNFFGMFEMYAAPWSARLPGTKEEPSGSPRIGNLLRRRNGKSRSQLSAGRRSTTSDRALHPLVVDGIKCVRAEEVLDVADRLQAMAGDLLAYAACRPRTGPGPRAARRTPSNLKRELKGSARVTHPLSSHKPAASGRRRGLVATTLAWKSRTAVSVCDPKMPSTARYVYLW